MTLPHRPGHRLPLLLACLAAGALGTLLPATGRADVGGQSMPPAASPTPAVNHVVRRVAGTVSYQNGGIGDEEVADLDAHASGYNLRLTFSEGNDNSYAAALKLRITSASGATVLSLDDAGPLTDVALPPGKYKVTAFYGDVARTGTVEVGRHGRATLNLHWNHEHPTAVAPDTPDGPAH